MRNTVKVIGILLVALLVTGCGTAGIYTNSGQTLVEVSYTKDKLVIRNGLTSGEFKGARIDFFLEEETTPLAKIYPGGSFALTKSVWLRFGTYEQLLVSFNIVAPETERVLFVGGMTLTRYNYGGYGYGYGYNGFQARKKLIIITSHNLNQFGYTEGYHTWDYPY